MNVRSLYYFMVIAEEGSFSKASKVLHISQPPLSNQIKNLEIELGVQLFDRKYSGVSLTNSGQYLFEESKKIFNRLDDIEKKIKTVNNEKKQLSIGCIPTCSEFILGEWINLVNKRTDKIYFETFEGDSTSLFKLLDKGAIDIAIVRLPIDETKYNSITLFDEPTCIAVSKESQLAKVNKGSTIKYDCLAKEKLILPDRIRAIFPVTDSMIKNFNVSLKCSSVMQALSMARKNIGLAVVPKSSRFISENSNLKYYKIVSPSFYSSIAIVWNNDKELDTNLEETFIALKQNIKGLFD